MYARIRYLCNTNIDGRTYPPPTYYISFTSFNGQPYGQFQKYARDVPEEMLYSEHTYTTSEINFVYGVDRMMVGSVCSDLRRCT